MTSLRSLVRSGNCCLQVLAVMLASLGLGAFGGCQTPRTSDRHVSWIEPPEAKVAMQGERRFLAGRTAGVWVDVRTKEDYRKGRIPGAIHMPLETVREDHVLLSGYDTIIVYGRDRMSPRANAVSKILLEKGYKDVRTLRGGFESWREAGRPVEEG